MEDVNEPASSSSHSQSNESQTTTTVTDDEISGDSSSNHSSDYSRMDDDGDDESGSENGVSSNDDDSSSILLLIQRAGEYLKGRANEDEEGCLIDKLIDLAAKRCGPLRIRLEEIITLCSKGVMSDASDCLKGKLVKLVNDIRKMYYGWHVDSSEDIVIILRYSILSDNRSLKETGLSILQLMAAALEKDSLAAVEIFEKLMNDDDVSLRPSIIKAFRSAFLEGDENLQSTLASFIPTIIKWAHEKKPKVEEVKEVDEEKMDIDEVEEAEEDDEEEDEDEDEEYGNVEEEEYHALECLNAMYDNPVIQSHLPSIIDLCSTIILKEKDLMKKRSIAVNILNSLFSEFGKESASAYGEERMFELSKYLTTAALSARRGALIDGMIGLLGELANKSHDKRTLGEIFYFLKNCAANGNSYLKKESLQIVEIAPNVFEDVADAKSFFERILTDNDRLFRSDALDAYILFTQQITNDDVIQTLASLIPTIIETSLNTSGPSSIRELVRLCTNLPMVITRFAPDQIPAIIESVLLKSSYCYEDEADWMEMDELDGLRWVHEGPVILISRALGKAEIFSISISVAQSLMQNEKWQKRLVGLKGLVSFGKREMKWMGERIEENVENIMPLLMDPIAQVRSASCVALGKMSSLLNHSYSTKSVQESTHGKVLSALVSSLKDEVPRVAAHASNVLSQFIASCPKDLLSSHFNSIMVVVEERLENTEMQSMGGKILLKQIFLMISSIARSGEEFIAPYYTNLIFPLKKCLRRIPYEDEEEYEVVQLLPPLIECISHMGIVVGKEKFYTDATDVLLTLAPHLSVLPLYDTKSCLVLDAIGRFATIFGSDFAPFLPILMPTLMKIAAFSCSYDCNCRTVYCYKRREPSPAKHAQQTLTTFLQLFGRQFNPYMADVLKTIQEQLTLPPFDRNHWAIEALPLLLTREQDVAAKRQLWLQFWPSLKKACKIMNSNKYSTKAISFILSSTQQLGAEGLTDKERCETMKWIDKENNKTQRIDDDTRMTDENSEVRSDSDDDGQ